MVYGGEKMNLIKILLQWLFVFFIDWMFFILFLITLGLCSYSLYQINKLPDYTPSLELIEKAQHHFSSIDRRLYFDICKQKYECYEDLKAKTIGRDYDTAFGTISLDPIVKGIEDMGYYKGFLTAISISLFMLMLIGICKKVIALLSETIILGNHRYKQSISSTQQEVTRITQLLKEANSQLEYFKNIIESKNEKLNIKTDEIYNDTLDKLQSIQEKITYIQAEAYRQESEAFELMVEHTKNTIIASNEEISKETQNTINQLQTMLKEIRESMDVYIAIAQKKKANEEKRKYHGKVKDQQLKEQTKQELIKEGRRIRDERE